eukprot:Rmarinus@m.16524
MAFIPALAKCDQAAPPVCSTSGYRSVKTNLGMESCVRSETKRETYSNPSMVTLGNLYGTSLIAGGLTGFWKKASLPSLISGLVTGSLIYYGSYLMSKGDALGITLCAAVAAFLTFVFFFRYMSTGKLMPAVPMGALSLALAILFGKHR